MGNIRISGNEPSSVSQIQTQWFKKLKSDHPKKPKQIETKK